MTGTVRRVNFTRTAAALVGLTMLATACGSSSNQAAPAASEPPAAPAETTAVDAAPPAAAPATDGSDTAEPVVVPAALQFSAPLVGGGELDVATLAGKPTVFWFWAPT